MKAAQRYAEALYSLATERGELKTVFQELTLFLEMVEKHLFLKGFLYHPLHSNKNKVKAVTALVTEQKFHSFTQNFLKILAANGRMKCLTEIIKVLDKKVKKDKNEIEVVATVPTALSTKQVEALKKDIESALKKPVALNVIEDKSILGGIILQSGSFLVDDSYRRKLQTITHIMKGVV